MLTDSDRLLVVLDPRTVAMIWKITCVAGTGLEGLKLKGGRQEPQPDSALSRILTVF
jgi:hypothetical protein